MQISETLEAEAQETLQDLVDAVEGILATVISTEDGFELVSLARNNAQASRLSAMASSMVALGAMATDECDIGRFSTITLEADSGVIIMLRANHTDSKLILSVIADSQALIGKVLLYSKKATKRLEQHG